MTEQEAMEIIMQVAYDGEFPKNSNEAFGVACKCIERQIPKKVEWGKTAKVRNRNTVTWVCPVCRYHVTSEYCRKCGQAIKWE